MSLKVLSLQFVVKAKTLKSMNCYYKEEKLKLSCSLLKHFNWLLCYRKLINQLV